MADVVETARGPIEPAVLGQTLMHEHVFIRSPEIAENYPGDFDADRAVADASARLEDLWERGVRTIVDLTVLGLGRNVPLVQRVAGATRVNIVVATGLYTYDELPFYFRFRGPHSGPGGIDPMAAMFIGDIRDGIAGTGIRAGVLKCATDEAGLTPGVERVLRAVARAHRDTGVPISTHTHSPSRQGLVQQEVFESEGVDLGRVVIGHSGDTTDLGYLQTLLDRGSYLGMDRFGADALLPFEDRVATVAALCERGYADRLVLSHDASCYSDWFDMELIRKVQPRWSYTHISDDVVPALLERGVSTGQVNQMLVDNPVSILGRSGAY